jgi:hypothetical protein
MWLCVLHRKHLAMWCMQLVVGDAKAPCSVPQCGMWQIVYCLPLTQGKAICCCPCTLSTESSCWRGHWRPGAMHASALDAQSQPLPATIGTGCVRTITPNQSKLHGLLYSTLPRAEKHAHPRAHQVRHTLCVVCDTLRPDQSLAGPPKQ